MSTDATDSASPPRSLLASESDCLALDDARRDVLKAAAVLRTLRTEARDQAVRMGAHEAHEHLTVIADELADLKDRCRLTRRAGPSIA